MGVPKIEIVFIEATTMKDYAEWFARRLRDTLGDRQQSDLLQLMKENGFEMKGGRLSHYMNGRNYPDPPVLAELARALDVSADYLLGLTEEKMPVEDLREIAASAKGESRINRLLKALPDEAERQVIDFAEYLVMRQSSAEDNLTPRQRAIARAQRTLASVEKEFGEAVRIELEKIIRTKGLPLPSGSM